MVVGYMYLCCTVRQQRLSSTALGRLAAWQPGMNHTPQQQDVGGRAIAHEGGRVREPHVLE